MKKILLLICFSSIYFSVTYSQDKVWLNDDAEWYYTFYSGNGTYRGYFRYFNVRDTVVAGRDCRTMDFESSDPQYYIEFSPKIITYEEGEILYYYVRNNFYPLYDFTKEVGDTLQIVVETPENETDSIAYLVVEETGEYISDNDTFRTMSLTSPFDGNNGNSSAADAFHGTVIEGVGHLTSFIPVYLYGVSCDFSCPVELRCFSDNMSSLKLVEEDCNSVNTNDLNLPKNEFKIFPNPIQGGQFLEIRTGSEWTGTSLIFEIIDTAGKLIQSKEMTWAQRINFKDVSPGIYFIKVRAENEVYIEKVIVK